MGSVVLNESHFIFVGATGNLLRFTLYLASDAMGGPTPYLPDTRRNYGTDGIYMIARVIFYTLLRRFRKLLWRVRVLLLRYGRYNCLKQNDIKKVLAYSTVSQLDTFLGLGWVLRWSRFHVMTHAFFKAL